MSHNNRAQHKLLSDAQKGNIDAFDRLFDHLSDPLYRFLFFRIGEQEEARDLLHDLFLELWRSLPNFQFRESVPFTAWVYKIARRKLADFWRKKQKRKTISLEALIAAGYEPQAASWQGNPRLEVGEVLNLIGRLPAKEREVVTLCYLEEISAVEVGKILNLKPNYVRQLAHRALKRLKGWLGGEVAK